MTRVCLLASALLCGGCWDFVEPELPGAGAPAVLQVSAFVDEAGVVDVNAMLVPGFTIGGLQRAVEDDTVAIYGMKLGPRAVRKSGTREYSFQGRLDSPNPLTVPFTVTGPAIQEVSGPPPYVRWLGIRKTDPDTIVWLKGTELQLHVDTTLARNSPSPQIRQWFLELRGDNRSFRVSSDGYPPAILRVPTEWIPASTNGILTAQLSFYQSGTQRSPSNDYIGNISFTVSIRWVIKVSS